MIIRLSFIPVKNLPALIVQLSKCLECFSELKDIKSTLRQLILTGKNLVTKTPVPFLQISKEFGLVFVYNVLCSVDHKVILDSLTRLHSVITIVSNLLI